MLVSRVELSATGVVVMATGVVVVATGVVTSGVVVAVASSGVVAAASSVDEFSVESATVMSANGMSTKLCHLRRRKSRAIGEKSNLRGSVSSPGDCPESAGKNSSEGRDRSALGD